MTAKQKLIVVLLIVAIILSIISISLMLSLDSLRDIFSKKTAGNPDSNVNLVIEGNNVNVSNTSGGGE